MDERYQNLVNAKAWYTKAMFLGTGEEWEEAVKYYQSQFVDEFDVTPTTWIGRSLNEWLQEGLHLLTIGELVGPEFEYFLDNVAYEVMMRRVIRDMEEWIVQTKDEPFTIQKDSKGIEVTEKHVTIKFEDRDVQITAKELDILLQSIHDVREEKGSEDQYTIEDLGSDWY